MYLKVLALDLDGTLAYDDQVAPTTWQLLQELKEAGFALILVTGRMLSALKSMGPFEQLFEALVVEDGAVVYYPNMDTLDLPFGRVSPSIIESLQQRKIPMEQGMAIAATWTPHDKQVLEVLSESGGGATLEYNKGAVMILPPGATKGTGLLSALRELGYSPHNVLACGDAENDRSLFEQAEISVAMAHSAPGIQEIADVVLDAPGPGGIQSLFTQLLHGQIPSYCRRSHRKISLGNPQDHSENHIHPSLLLNGNLGIVGSSGSGKSWLAGLLVEKLLRLNYQVCIIDPEGDYRGMRAFPHTLLLGGQHHALPPVAEVLTLCEYSDINLILDLSQSPLTLQQAYVGDLLQGLTHLRKRRGKPHWFLLDEAHYFCSPHSDSHKHLILEAMRQGGLGLVSYRPSLMAPEVLRAIDHWLLTQLTMPEEIALLSTLDHTDLTAFIQSEQLPALCRGQAYFGLGSAHACNGATTSGLLQFDTVRRRIPHIRHLHKYLLAPLPPEKRFYFHISEPYVGPYVAASLGEFHNLLPQIPLSTLEYHIQRNDFERWLKGVLNDEALAQKIQKLKRKELEGEDLREALVRVVSRRFAELSSLV